MNEFIEKIIAYEDGTLTDEETIKLFQELIDSKVIDQLQGSYQRMAQLLIDDGLVDVP